MLRPRFVILPFFALLTATTGTRAADREMLRHLAHLPIVSMTFGYGVSGRGEFVNLADAGSRPEKIAKIEKELKGDSTDAERYRYLGRLYGEARQSAESKEAFYKAEKLFRQQYGQHPKDNALRLRLADTLEELKQYEEAETLLRRAVKEAPEDWHSWVELAKFLDWRADRTIKRETPSSPGDGAEAPKSKQATQPTPEQIRASKQDLKEAATCYKRAIALAPREPEIYRQRGAARYRRSCSKDNPNFDKGMIADVTGFFEAEALSDFRRAVSLSPDAYEGIGMVEFMEGTRDAYQQYMRNPKAKPPEKMLDVVSQSVKDHLREDMARLEKGMKSPDKHKAAEAAEVLGALQFLFYGDKAGAEDSLRRSIALDPARRTAWEVLSLILVETQQPKTIVEFWHPRSTKVVELWQQRLKHEDSAHVRFFLAKAYEDLGQFDKAEEEVRAGLKRDPDDFMLKLALANLLLMRGTDESVKKAGQLLCEIRKDHMPEGGNENRWGNWTFSCGIYFGLKGDTKAAKQWLEKFQQRQPEYPFIKEALEVLGDARRPLIPLPPP